MRGVVAKTSFILIRGLYTIVAVVMSNDWLLLTNLLTMYEIIKIRSSLNFGPMILLFPLNKQYN